MAVRKMNLRNVIVRSERDSWEESAAGLETMSILRLENVATAILFGIRSISKTKNFVFDAQLAALDVLEMINVPDVAWASG